MTSTGKQRRGFAAMDPAKQRKIAASGGRRAHEKGVAHEFDSKEAKAAGRIGGNTVSKDNAHMARIGRIGGGKSKRRVQPESEGLP